jgi:hypothetical protein
LLLRRLQQQRRRQRSSASEVTRWKRSIKMALLMPLPHIPFMLMLMQLLFRLLRRHT